MAYHGASLFLMLGHIPFGDVLFTAKVTHEGSYTGMFSQMYLEVGSGVVFLVTTFEFAMELVNILMCFLVVSQNPLLSELGVASWLRTNELLVFLFFVSCQVI
jgi:hypothetical protein